MKNFILILLFIIAVFLGLSLLLNHFFKKYKYIKYIPALIMLILTIYSFYIAKTSTEGFLDIAYMLLSIMSAAGFLSSLITSLVLDYIQNKI